MDLYKVRTLLSNGKSINDIPLRVTFYSRVSTELEAQISSLQNQVDYFEEMIKSNKNWIYHPGYIDHGISGTVDKKRPNFMNMIRDAKNNAFDLIITKEISRFSRNTLDSIKYTRELLSYGVAVYFINDNINTSLLDSELRLTIMASLAQDEVRRLSERVKFGMKRSIKNGHILGNDLMYGYKKDKVNNALVINKDESKMVKKLFVLYGINKLSLHSIANIFNHESEYKKWNVTTLSRMIRNPKYKGFYCGGKSEVVDYMSKRVEKIDKSKWVMYEDNKRIPPIVSISLFDLANKRLDDASLCKSHKIIKYPLSNKIFCSCGRVLYKRKMSKNKGEVVWFCKNSSCKTNIRESEIVEIIKDVFKIDYNHIMCLLIDNYKMCIKNKSDDLIKSEIDSLKLKKEKILELNLDNCISNLEFKDKNDYYNYEIQRLKDELKKDKNTPMLNKIGLAIDYYFENNKLIDDLIKLVVKRIDLKCIDLENVKMCVYTNLQNVKITNKSYQFKRGYDVVGTRRYLFNVLVYIN